LAQHPSAVSYIDCWQTCRGESEYCTADDCRADNVQSAAANHGAHSSSATADICTHRTQAQMIKVGIDLKNNSSNSSSKIILTNYTSIQFITGDGGGPP